MMWTLEANERKSEPDRGLHPLHLNVEKEGSNLRVERALVLSGHGQGHLPRKPGEKW
jgi:hypothetical protein